MRSENLRKDLKKKICAWLVSFHRLDPRHKILRYFNLVASEGADKFCGDDEDEEYGYSSSKVYTKVEKILQDAFNTTSILTVWRPCSNDAMRKMMEGAGVGKGLDIKGKSAKKGELSAFVPFLQIHDNSHKKEIQNIARTAKLRVYYSSLEARQVALQEFQSKANDHVVFDPETVLPSSIVELNQFATSSSSYGLELHQRLFWKVYVTDRDITRGEDTETGRPSTPGFQDANLKTLKLACEQQKQQKQQQASSSNHHTNTNNTTNSTSKKPVPVVFQYSKDNPMSPQHLVMAYEEHGKVTPVVSDFDGFLLGWRREALWFGCNLPREQEDLMVWCVDQIEKILDSPPSTDTWTVRWLELLKEESTNNNFHPHIPDYGFGDPKSYGIMERAAEQLIDTGAVRHGSECFNYYFPQEIDDTFLLISDTLKQPVPWKYVNVQELQRILSQQIKDGFVFPLNPKWILCDPGWKDLYDELMASQALYAEYTKDVWYPPFSGVRKKIDKISKKHPNGFRRLRGRVSFIASLQSYSPLRQDLEKNLTHNMSGNTAFDLAELELENYTLLHNKSSLAQQIKAAASIEGLGLDDDGDSYRCDDSDNNDNDEEQDDFNASMSGIRFDINATGGSEESRRDFRRSALTAHRNGNGGAKGL